MIAQSDTQYKQTASIHPSTRLGHVHLTVADLESQISFHQRVLGLQVHWREAKSAGLGTGQEDFLRLTQVDGARRPRHTTGLYHFALEFPSRRELARAIARLFALRYENYPTDHVISKTTYLDDPEGQNIELYVPTPEDGTYQVIDGRLEVRHRDGTPSDGREALDVQAMFRELTPNDQLDAPAPQEVKLGHIHLYAADLEKSMHFYRDVLGFQELSLVPFWRMADVTLNGYLPHVVAFNTWQGAGVPPPPPDSLGIRYFEIVLPNQAELERVVERVQGAGLAIDQTRDGVMVRDPNQIQILLAVRPGV